MKVAIGALVAFLVIRPQLHAIYHASFGSQVWREEAPFGIVVIVVLLALVAYKNNNSKK